MSVDQQLNPMDNVIGKNVVTKIIADMKLLGIFYMAFGIIFCLTIAGAIFGVPLFLSGRRLRDAAGSFAAFQSSDDPEELHKAIQKQGLFFSIHKILMIIGVVLVISLLVVFVLIFSFHD